jgi:hypothetical protein
MTRRLVVLTLIGSLGCSSMAFAGETLLQSGVRIAGEVGRGSVALPAAGLAGRGAGAPGVMPVRAETVDGRGEQGVQGAPAVATSPMRKRTKVLIFLAAGVGFGVSAYAIDRHVLNITPSSLGTRKD